MFCVQVVPMETLNKELLIALLDLAQMDVSASVQALAEATGHPRTKVASGLNALAEKGLIRPETVRLTMVGLVQAASLRARRPQTRSVAA